MLKTCLQLDGRTEPYRSLSLGFVVITNLVVSFTRAIMALDELMKAQEKVLS